MVERGVRIPLADRVLLERSALLNIIDQLVIAIPQEIQLAEKMAQERERILDLANNEAEEIIASARKEAERLISQSSITHAAELEAAAVVARAEQVADGIVDEAETYTTSELRVLEKQLTRMQRVVARGIAYLDERHQARQQPGPSIEPASEAPAAE